MAHKSGISHGCAALAGLILGEVLLFYLTPFLGPFLKGLERIFGTLAGWLRSATGVVLPPDIFVPALVASFLAFLWGMVYHWGRHGRGSED